MDPIYHVIAPINGASSSSSTFSMPSVVTSTIGILTYPPGTTISCNVAPCPGAGVCSICGTRTGS